MTPILRRRLLLATALLASILLVVLNKARVDVGVHAAADLLPDRLTSQEFWKISSDFSEQDGTFHSENLVSNEARFQTILPALLKTAKPGRAYMGVGSEQNFTYIAALQPEIAFIVDIRRGNLDLHLVYKAIFEMSATRAEFVSKLFSRKQPAGLSDKSTAAEIFEAYARVPSSDALYQQNLKAIESHLVNKHGFGLSKGDLGGIQFVYNAWFVDGPDIHYQLNGANGGRGGNFPTYADLMTATDGAGRTRSYLATEESFKFLKDLETKNLVIPVVGNFAGSKAIRAVGNYLKQKEAVVSAFYLSNVEQYLVQDGIWNNFCANVATLPLDSTSTFIRSSRGGFGGGRLTQGGLVGGGAPGGGFALEIRAIPPVIASCSR